MLTKKMPKNAQDFVCEDCDFKCNKKSNYNKHLCTTKHINANNANNNNANIKKDYKCNNCDLTLKHLSSLSRHKKKCLLIKTSDFEDIPENNIVMQDASANEIKVLTSLVLEVVKSNQDLQKQMIDVCQKIQPSNSIINTNSHNNTTNNNKTFNLNFFLNEQCKDAMNINDFVKSIQIEMSDLERIGKEGYVEGISKLILEKLRETDIYKRPLHCSDAKRETMYIKENDVWNKDESLTNEKLIKFVKDVDNKNYDFLMAYALENRDVFNGESNLNTPFLYMVKNSTRDAEGVKKVIKKIIKEVLIKK